MTALCHNLAHRQTQTAIQTDRHIPTQTAQLSNRQKPSIDSFFMNWEIWYGETPTLLRRHIWLTNRNHLTTCHQEFNNFSTAPTLPLNKLFPSTQLTARIQFFFSPRDSYLTIWYDIQGFYTMTNYNMHISD